MSDSKFFFFFPEELSRTAEIKVHVRLFCIPFVARCPSLEKLGYWSVPSLPLSTPATQTRVYYRPGQNGHAAVLKLPFLHLP